VKGKQKENCVNFANKQITNPMANNISILGKSPIIEGSVLIIEELPIVENNLLIEKYQYLKMFQ
jgi:hypothetical protein